MIIPNFATFRYRFAVHVHQTLSVTFAMVAGVPTLTRGAGSWITDGVKVGMKATFQGTASNDFEHTVATVAALTITFAAAETVTAEGPVSALIDFVSKDKDAYETWPVALVRKAASGFGNAGSTITGIPKPLLTNDAFTITCNAAAADAAFHVDDYDWYLSQRTDVVASQLLSIAQAPDAGGLSYSGSIAISVTSLAGITPSAKLTADDLYRLFRYQHLYVRRASDGAIQWVDLFQAMNSDWNS